jgi:hypothetical protein
LFAGWRKEALRRLFLFGIFVVLFSFHFLWTGDGCIRKLLSFAARSRASLAVFAWE